jgi:hypothetical protein
MALLSVAKPRGDAASSVDMAIAKSFREKR